MKKNNKPKKKQQIWAKSVLPLSVALGLQAYTCGPVDTHTNLARTSASEFREAIKNQKDISIPSQGGIDLLHAAVEAGNLQNVKEVLARAESDQKLGRSFQHPEFPNVLDSQGRLALNKAIQGGKTAIAIALIQSKCIDILKTDKKGRSPFHMAARCKNKKVIDALYVCVINKEDPRKYTEEQVNKSLLNKTKGSKDSKGYNVFTAALLPKHRLVPVEAVRKQLDMYVYVSNKFEKFLKREEKEQVPVEAANDFIASLDSPGNAATTYLIPEKTDSSLKEESAPVSTTPNPGNANKIPVPPPAPIPTQHVLGMPTKPSLSAKQEDPRKPAQNETVGTHNALLEEIRKGIKLKPRNSTHTKPPLAAKPNPTSAEQTLTMADILRKVVKQRQIATQGPETDDDSSVSDEEWGD
ncbi:MAG TPA: ankyrin repeat domain-containing protein [Amoebophilaceae bacterium]|jgi:hypothetical protein|nr:ankyrin repeat domain-containing protein [Amoebophilaceae bacterium]